jgi:hypothetical protein
MRVSYSGEQLDAGHVRHAHIGNHDVERSLIKQHHCFVRAQRKRHLPFAAHGSEQAL